MNALLLLAALAAAHGPDPLKEACWDDVQKLCPGSNNPGMCVEQNWDAVSEGCRAAKLEMKKRWEAKQGHKQHNQPEPRVKEACGENWERKDSEACQALKAEMKKKWQEDQAKRMPDPRMNEACGENMELRDSKTCQALRAEMKKRWEGQKKPQPKPKE